MEAILFIIALMLIGVVALVMALALGRRVRSAAAPAASAPAAVI
ncbi:hypothetical protein [Cryobacterium sp. MLB-32]|nr:hypothetical protein [Cryobacterium sp. MLB-32]